MNNPEQTFIMTSTCDAGVGVVAAVTSFLADHGCYICTLEQFDDQESSILFMRIVFNRNKDSSVLDEIEETFPPVAAPFNMQWTVRDAAEPTKTLLMVSHDDHCLNDLLYRKNKGEINVEFTAIVSNHTSLKYIADHEGIPFYHLPVTKENKREQEQQLLNIINETNTELVVLARYMQILSNDLCAELKGRCINIHHSFLPGFKGAKPYHQAFDRGVKIIGATAHYVTADLDEGPIIEQALSRVNHNYSPEAMAATGRHNECKALAMAIKYHTEYRVFIDENKTVVFTGTAS